MSGFFELRSAGMRYGEARVLRDVTLHIDAPQMVAIVGPNGAGKSTLLGIMAGLRQGFEGECLFRGRSITQWRRREFARQVAFVPQSVKLDFPFTAAEVVLMGRTPYAGGWFETPQDAAAVERAMETTEMLAFRERDFRSLSGGERQRVILASALAQSPQVLLLDEPTTFLDLHHQLSIYALLSRLARQGLLVVTVTHDLNLAASHADRVIALKAGAMAADAAPREALSPARISELYGVHAEILHRPGGGEWIAYGG